MRIYGVQIGKVLPGQSERISRGQADVGGSTLKFPSCWVTNLQQGEFRVFGQENGSIFGLSMGVVIIEETVIDEATGIGIKRGRPARVLMPGEYFALRGQYAISGACFVVDVEDYHALGMVGGPIEHEGRLTGFAHDCTVIVPPPCRLDPCLVHLAIPPGAVALRCRHRAYRAGVVARGRGRVHALDSVGNPLETIPEVGDVFIIPPWESYRLLTDGSGDTAMDLVLFDPCSLSGPTDENNPVIKSTEVYTPPARPTYEIVGPIISEDGISE